MAVFVPLDRAFGRFSDRMDSAQKTRCYLLLLVTAVIGGVFVFGQRKAPLLSIGEDMPVSSAPLQLRKLGDSHANQSAPATSNQRFLPIPDNAVPIEWERVSPRSRAPVPTQTRGYASATQRAQPQAALSPPPPKPKVHRVVDGESLRDIAARYLGSPDRFMEIFYANRAQLPHPDVLPLGARLVIPDPSARVSPQPSAQFTPVPSRRYVPPQQMTPDADGFRSRQR